MAMNRRGLLKRFAGGMAVWGALPGLDARLEEEAGQGTPAGSIAQRIRLDRNENAYGASSRVVGILRDDATRVNLFPGATGALREELAKQHGVSGEQIVVGCGSSEVLRMAATAFLGLGKKLVLASPTFDLIGRFGSAHKANVVKVPLQKNYAHDLEGMLSHLRGGAGLVYICNPNNPTGTITERREIERFLEKLPPSAYAIVDEAYHQYAGGSGAYASFLERRVENPTLIVTRTFSIAYGLAALRVGYAVASKEVAGRLILESLPYGVNGPGLLAAEKALGDSEHIQNCVEANARDRQEFLNQVNARMLRALNSHTNFVCLNVMRPAAAVVEHFKKNNITLAPIIPELPTYLRISLGRPEEMQEFWRVWDLQGPQPMSM